MTESSALALHPGRKQIYMFCLQPRGGCLRARVAPLLPEITFFSGPRQAVLGPVPSGREGGVILAQRYQQVGSVFYACACALTPYAFLVGTADGPLFK